MRVIGTILLLAFSFGGYTQEMQEVGRCTNKDMHTRLVSMDDEWEGKGFKITVFNLMSMPSGYFVPVQVPVQEGREYKVFFLAHKNYQQYSFALIDDKRNKLTDLKVKSKTGQSNEFTHSFKATYTGTMWIILSQKVRGSDDACGGISVLEAAQ